MFGSVKDNEANKFRGEIGLSKVAVTNEQGLYNPVPVSLQAEDSFGRIKTAQANMLFDASFQYSIQLKVFIKNEITGGTVTHNAVRSAATITSTSTIGSYAQFRSRNYFQYSPAFTNTMIGSFCFHGHNAGVSKKIGLFDERNGFFLESFNDTFYVAIRSSISGSAQDLKIARADWNFDVFDGSGSDRNPSGLLLDSTKQQIIYIQYQWLGSGRVTFGFLINGQMYIAHYFDHANLISSLYSQTGTLPIQTEVRNISGTGGYMEFTCCSLVSNGATSQHGHLYTVSNGITPRNLPSAGTSYPIISIRKKPGFTNIPVQILDMNVFSTSNDDFFIQVVHKPILVGATWVDVDSALVQSDVTATSFTGGDVVSAFYMKGNLQASEKLELLSRFWDLTLGDDFAGNSEIMTIAATPITTNALLYGVIAFKVFE